MIVGALVFQDETDLFAFAHPDPGGFESHFLPVFAHGDIDGAGRLFRVTRLAGGKAVLFVGIGDCVQANANCAAVHESEKQCTGYQSIGIEHEGPHSVLLMARRLGGPVHHAQPGE